MSAPSRPMGEYRSTVPHEGSRPSSASGRSLWPASDFLGPEGGATRPPSRGEGAAAPSRSAVAHINLLQQGGGGEQRQMSWAVLGVLAATLIGLTLYAKGPVAAAHAAAGQRDQAEQQAKLLRARLQAHAAEQARQAGTIALRQEVETLRPQAGYATALLEAVRALDGGKGEDFGRALGSVTSLEEPGLWLTAVSVTGAGKRLELKGTARSANTVLRYARRVNEALSPLGVRLDALEIQPLGAEPHAVGVTFRLS